MSYSERALNESAHHVLIETFKPFKINSPYMKLYNISLTYNLNYTVRTKHFTDTFMKFLTLSVNLLNLFLVIWYMISLYFKWKVWLLANLFVSGLQWLVLQTVLSVVCNCCCESCVHSGQIDCNKNCIFSSVLKPSEVLIINIKQCQIICNGNCWWLYIRSNIK